MSNSKQAVLDKEDDYRKYLEGYKKIRKGGNNRKKTKRRKK